MQKHLEHSSLNCLMSETDLPSSITFISFSHHAPSLASTLTYLYLLWVTLGFWLSHLPCLAPRCCHNTTTKQTSSLLASGYYDVLWCPIFCVLPTRQALNTRLSAGWGEEYGLSTAPFLTPQITAKKPWALLSSSFSKGFLFSAWFFSSIKNVSIIP